MNRSLTRFLLGSFLAALVVPVVIPASAVAAPSGSTARKAVSDRGIGIRLLDAATSRRNDPRAHLYIDDFVHPGTTLTRHVQVSNLTPHAVHLLVYSDAATVTRAGFDIAAGDTPNELTSWMAVGVSTLNLAPGRSATVPVTIDVPRTASAGERYGAILAELPAPAPTAAHHVTVATRVGVRVYLDVGSGGEPASGFTISTLTARRLSNGVPVVTAAVTNTGGRAIDLTGSLTLTNGPGGLRAGPYDVPSARTLGINESGNVVIPLDRQTPVGPWLATMTLRSGYIVHKVRATVRFPTSDGAAAAPVKAVDVPLAKNRHVVVPIALLIIALLALGLLLLWWRSRDPDDDATEERLPTVDVPLLAVGARQPFGQR